jgi:hypothetical protein
MTIPDGTDDDDSFLPGVPFDFEMMILAVSGEESFLDPSSEEPLK